MVSRVVYGLILACVMLLYLWLAYDSIDQGLARGDWVAYLGAALFLAAAIGAALAGMNLVRAKRR